MRTWIAGLLIAVCGVAAAKERVHDTRDVFGMERITPHVAWGAPLHGGAIRTLFIAPRYTMRDAVELGERLELDVETVPLWDSGHAGIDTAGSQPEFAQYTGEAALQNLRDALNREHDLIVMGNLDPTVLPDDVVAALVEKVKGGAGLLLAHVDNTVASPFKDFIDSLQADASGAEVTKGIGEALTPEWGMGLQFVKTLSAGPGRVAILGYDGAVPATHFLLPALGDPAHAEPECADTYFSLVAKAARWAAGRSPDSAIASVTLSDPAGPSESEIPPGFPEEYVELMRTSGVKRPYHVYRVALAEPADRNLDVQWRIREPGFKTVFSRLIAAPIKKGGQSADIQVFAGPGKHYVDVWLVDKKGVVDWFTEPITLDGWPDLTEMRYSKGLLLANDSLEVAATIKPTYSQPRGCTLYARAKDSFGRLVVEAYQDVPQEGGAARVRLDFVDLITNYVSVEVFAVDSARGPFSEFVLWRSAHDGRAFPVRTPYQRGSFSFVAQTSGASEYNERGYNSLLAEMGVDTASVSGDRFTGLHLAESGLRPAPLLAPELDANHDLSMDPEARRAVAERLQAAVKQLPGAGSPLYTLGDWDTLRPAVEQLAKSQGLQRAFGEWLRKEYGDSIQRLNTAWGTAYNSWDAIVPVEPPAGDKPERFAPRIDAQRFLDAFAASILDEKKIAIRAIDGDAIAGVTVAGDADWGSLAAHADLLCVPASECAAEKLRSYGVRGSFTGEWFNGATGADASAAGARAPWHAVMHGLSSVWYANGVGTLDNPELRGAVDPFGRPTVALTAAAESVERIKSGVGAMLLRATPAHSGIAIYDSPASAYLGEMEKTFDCGADQAEAAFAGILGSLGYSFDFISEAALKRGDLKNYTVLLLPMTRALDGEEASAIRKFCEGGGRVVADLLPGRYDTHGVPYEQPILADLFGVTARSTGEAGPAASATITVDSGDEEVKETLATVIPDTSVSATDAVPSGTAGDAPVWFVRKVGSGETVLANHILADHSKDGGERSDDAALRALFGALMREFGVSRGAEVTGPKHGAFSGECFEYRYGAATIVGLLRDADGGPATESVRLTMKSKGVVYDVLQGLRLTRSKGIPVRLARGEAALFAQLPYDVTGIIVLAPETVPAGRRVTVRMKVRTQGELAGEHVVHVDIAPRNGKPLRYYSRDVVCPSGEGETYIPLARNESPGFYQVTARDVLTGVEAATTVEITPVGR
ncbi:MAG: beta-galactosidase trimerization domain-containing protein [Candidatus Hydrogenedentes bacterium]|nr:beta-galactosidase trimerization domain-containing protein [Candidatus Hydrogenedentota bacterium]